MLLVRERVDAKVEEAAYSPTGSVTVKRVTLKRTSRDEGIKARTNGVLGLKVQLTLRRDSYVAVDDAAQRAEDHDDHHFHNSLHDDVAPQLVSFFH